MARKSMFNQGSNIYLGLSGGPSPEQSALAQGWSATKDAISSVKGSNPAVFSGMEARAGFNAVKFGSAGEKPTQFDIKSFLETSEEVMRLMEREGNFPQAEEIKKAQDEVKVLISNAKKEETAAENDVDKWFENAKQEPMIESGVGSEPQPEAAAIPERITPEEPTKDGKKKKGKLGKVLKTAKTAGVLGSLGLGLYGSLAQIKDTQQKRKDAKENMALLQKQMAESDARLALLDPSSPEYKAAKSDKAKLADKLRENLNATLVEDTMSQYKRQKAEEERKRNDIGANVGNFARLIGGGGYDDHYRRIRPVDTQLQDAAWGIQNSFPNANTWR